MQNFYKETITSKTGLILPVLKSGKTLESKYNPEEDANRKLSSLNENFSYYLVFGLGSGIFVNKLSSLHPEALILVVEYSKEDILFLKSLETVKSIKSSNVIITQKENLKETLINTYIPSLHGNIKIIEQQNYLQENENYSRFLKEELNKALEIISKDYSVQSHFGKTWQKNIISNMKTGSEPVILKIQKNKTCVILAAGPSLEEFLPKLKENRDSYFIIATDTAYLTASRLKITCDAVVSLDGQSVSQNHFLTKTAEETLYFFDCSSDSSAVRKTRKGKGNIIFFKDGHPLVSYLDKKKNKIPYLFSGAGTVTITALNAAFYMGFPKIEVWGADFSYPRNKPYVKGTYLDSLYNKNSSRIKSSETDYIKLMFRTELIKEDQNKTTEVLLSYRKSFEQYLNSKNVSFQKKQNIYVILNKVENISKNLFISGTNLNLIKKDLTDKPYADKDFEKALLPAMAYFRRKMPELNSNEIKLQAIKSLERSLGL